MHEQIGGTGTTDATMAGSAIVAKVIPFPESRRGSRPRRPLCLRPVAAD
jgi:hypothetical protein